MKTKPKNRSTYADQKRLLSLLYRKVGGLQAFADKVGISAQLAFFWRERGYVPLKRVEKVSKLLKVSPFALNFRGYKDFKGDEEVTWEKAVTGCKFSKDEVKYVLG